MSGEGKRLRAHWRPAWLNAFMAVSCWGGSLALILDVFRDLGDDRPVFAAVKFVAFFGVVWAGKAVVED